MDNYTVTLDVVYQDTIHLRAKNPENAKKNALSFRGVLVSSVLKGYEGGNIHIKLREEEIPGKDDEE